MNLIDEGLKLQRLKYKKEYANLVGNTHPDERASVSEKSDCVTEQNESSSFNKRIKIIKHHNTLMATKCITQSVLNREVGGGITHAHKFQFNSLDYLPFQLITKRIHATCFSSIIHHNCSRVAADVAVHPNFGIIQSIDGWLKFYCDYYSTPYRHKPPNSGIIHTVRWINTSDQSNFIILNEKNGYNHVELYNLHHNPSSPPIMLSIKEIFSSPRMIYNIYSNESHSQSNEYIYVCCENELRKCKIDAPYSSVDDILSKSTSNPTVCMASNSFSHSEHVIYCGRRNGCIMYIDQRITPYSTNTSNDSQKLCSLPHCAEHIQCLPLHGYKLVAQDITGNIISCDIRKPQSKSYKSPHESIVVGDCNVAKKRRFWISNDEQIIAAPIYSWEEDLSSITSIRSMDHIHLPPSSLRYDVHEKTSKMNRIVKLGLFHLSNPSIKRIIDCCHQDFQLQHPHIQVENFFLASNVGHHGERYDNRSEWWGLIGDITIDESNSNSSRDEYGPNRRRFSNLIHFSVDR